MNNILLGVTGGIAAYKSVYLARMFIKEGFNVKVIMTKSAEQFVTPLTFEAVTRNPVLTEDNKPYAISHIEYAAWADICIIAPATANTIGKINAGIADNELTSTILALRCKLVIAPAMNSNMYNNIIVQHNLEALENKGVIVLKSPAGELACKDYGTHGRMEEPNVIFQQVKELLNNNLVDNSNINKPLLNIKILVTLGGTREYIDPVRYITNYSSGKMGYAIVEEACRQGAYVDIIAGDTKKIYNNSNISYAYTSDEMYNKVTSNMYNYDIIIMAAAVTDYKVEHISSKKIKKSSDKISLELIKTKDILHYLGHNKKDEQVIVGFAAETNNVEEYAYKKLTSKKADIIAANDVSRDDIGFNAEDNDMVLLFADGKKVLTGKKSKKAIAEIILKESLLLYKRKHNMGYE